MSGKMIETTSRIARRGALGALAVAGLCMLQPAAAHGQLIESFENTLDGWTFNPTYNVQQYTTTFSTTTGVTNGSYSLEIDSGSNPRGIINGLDYGNLLLSPRTVALETTLSTASSVTIDYYNPSSLGYGPQIDVDIDGATGYNSLDGYSYPTPPAGQSTATYNITAAERAAMVADLASVTPVGVNLVVQAGSGGPNAQSAPAFYIDNVTAVPAPVPEPASIGIIGAGAAFLMKRRRKA